MPDGAQNPHHPKDDLFDVGWNMDFAADKKLTIVEVGADRAWFHGDATGVRYITDGNPCEAPKTQDIAFRISGVAVNASAGTTGT